MTSYPTNISFGDTHINVETDLENALREHNRKIVSEVRRLG